MKRLVTLALVCLLTIMKTAAQEIKVTGFKYLPNNTEALIGDILEDENGDPCAKIKVLTPQGGFRFDLKLGGFVVEQQDPNHDHPSETWIWVSPGKQQIEIEHPIFGKSKVFDIPIELESQRTYEMELAFPSGRFVNIRTVPEEGGTLIIDGTEIKEKSPVLRRFLYLGQHTIEARKDKFEGSLKINIKDSVKNHTWFEVEMKDMSHLYGNVVVTVEDNADILFRGKKEGTGEWRKQLKAGKYEVVTQKIDCDPQTTSFTVTAGKENRFVATPPVQHTGNLSIYTNQRNIKATLDGKDIDLGERLKIPVGKHALELTRKGYYPYKHEFSVKRYEEFTDTVQLERIKYVKPLAFYFGGGYTVGSVMGITGILGAVIYRNDLQLSYTFGTAETAPIHWYGNNGTWLATTKYKKSGLALKYGYQFNLQEMLAITPQVGFSHVGLSGTVSEGTGNYADGASSQLATIGVKLLLVPVHHLYVFAAPQYGVTLSKSTNFDLLSSHSDISVDGFSATLGVLFNF